MAKRKGESGTHRVMTRLFLELAGRLPVLSHCHQAHREDGSWLLLMTPLYAMPEAAG